MMEPMALGSPTHSPSSGGVSPGTGSYLPPFLLGEITSPSTPRTNSLSPTKGRNLAFGSPVSPSITSTPDQMLYRSGATMHHQAMYNQQQNVYSNIPASPNISYNKTNGPPIEDLYDTIKNNDPSVNNSNIFGDISLANNNSILQSPHHQSNLNHSLYNQPIKSSWQDGFQDSAEEHWVTVFGFPPSTANTVLARLYNTGTIIDKLYPTQGNWAHIRYATRAEKERALALNGRQIVPGIMVGVVNCKELPRATAVTSMNHTFGSPDRSVLTARSLCPTALPTSVTPQGSSGGIVSKTLEYLFGW